MSSMTIKRPAEDLILQTVTFILSKNLNQASDLSSSFVSSSFHWQSQHHHQ